VTPPHRPPVHGAHSLLRLAVGAGALAGAAGLLWVAGAAIPGPGTLDGPGLARWIEEDPVVVAVAAVRVVGLALTGWVAPSAVVALAVHATGLRRRATLRRTVDRLCLPTVRRLVHGAVGAATLSVAVLAQGATGAGAVAPAAAVAAPAAAEDAVTRRTPDDVAVMVALPGGSAAVDGDGLDGPEVAPASAKLRALLVALDPAPAPPPDAPGPTPDPRTATTWVVARGEHLWHVSEATLERHLGAPPDDAAVAAYLGRLIDANRDRLAVPDDPDLLFAGQELLVPPV
jgi:hypothetical protein